MTPHQKRSVKLQLETKYYIEKVLLYIIYLDFYLTTKKLPNLFRISMLHTKHLSPITSWRQFVSYI